MKASVILVAACALICTVFASTVPKKSQKAAFLAGVSLDWAAGAIVEARAAGVVREAALDLALVPNPGPALVLAQLRHGSGSGSGSGSGRGGRGRGRTPSYDVSYCSFATPRSLDHSESRKRTYTNLA